ncbi:hypothetical protein GQ53DRAFT_821635 [Thozetella sp. PMI_491]|nr:hypothetical protein GQ53DRAFT_821635 [Thozetella sp. PMI_491]
MSSAQGPPDDWGRQSTTTVRDELIKRVTRDLREATLPAYYGSIISKLADRHAEQHPADPQEESLTFGIQGDDGLILQTNSSNSSISQLERMLKRLMPPNFDFQRNPDTIPPEEKALCAPHLFRKSKGGFSDLYMSDEFCRYLSTTHSDPEKVPELVKYTSQQREYAAPESVAFETCASCDANFTFSLAPGTDPVVIIRGVPASGTTFQAISYVWGETVVCEIPCKSCNRITSVPLNESVTTLHRLLNQAGAGITVWLDCVSINQSDPTDIADILPQMGTIYETAERVCVILPSSDTRVFDLLGMAFCAAWTMLCSKEDFAHNRDVSVASNRKEQMLSAWTAEFIALIEELDANLVQAVYFQRAWTFQEWALAREIDVSHQDEMVGKQRSEVPGFLATVKKLFPHEEFWLAPDEIDAVEVSFQTGAANISGVEHALGIRAKEEPPANDSAAGNQNDPGEAGRQLLARRVMTMLTALKASARQARYEADLVACWASMSNLSYPYDKNDSIEQALLKVIPEIRRQLGLKIWNFYVTNDIKALSVDTTFMAMAAQQYIGNINVGSLIPLPSAPAFSGQVDTQSHIFRSMRQPYEAFLPSEQDVTMRRVKGARIEVVVPLDTVNGPLFGAIFSKITYGLGDSPDKDDPMFVAPSRWASELFEHIGRNIPQELMRRALAIVRVSVTIPSPEGSPGPERKIDLWAWVICPAPLSIKGGPPLVIARESLNGTLMLLQEISLGESLKIRNPVGYLTVSDNRSGTFLLPTSEDGSLDIRVPAVNIPGIIDSDYASDRIMRCTIDLADQEESVCIPDALQ